MTNNNEHPRVVVITGAAAGVGRAIATRFAAPGMKLGLISRDEAALAELARTLAAKGAQCAFAAIDVADADAVFAAAERFARELGPIDIWINDAMLTVFSPVHKITPDEFRRVTEVTYLGIVHGCMAALKQMRPRGQGHIINIGSALAYRGIPLQSAYCGAKHAIRGFTASLRAEQEHERHNIAVSIMELPAMNTPQFEWARTHMPRQPRPMGTVYQPEAAAEAVFRAAQTGAREYWVGWPTFLTIVGNMVAPSFMDWYLGRTAVQGQETAEPVQPNRRDNLLAPITELHATHGRFGSIAKPQAMILSGSWARAGVIAAGAFAFLLLGRLSASSRRAVGPDAGSSGRLPARSARGT
jgi:NAD(P)-dependent dehydrogenase (short-subunit alcohol dehydrogenase family)